MPSQEAQDDAEGPALGVTSEAVVEPEPREAKDLTSIRSVKEAMSVGRCAR